MSALTAQYATFADYMAACSSDKSAVVAHYAAEEAKAAEEAQQAKDAARYRWLRDGGHIVAAPIGGIALPFYTPGLLHKRQLDGFIDAQIAKEQ